MLAFARFRGVTKNDLAQILGFRLESIPGQAGRSPVAYECSQRVGPSSRVNKMHGPVRLNFVLSNAVYRTANPEHRYPRSPSRTFLWFFFSECESVEQNMARVSSVSSRVNAAVARFSFN